MTEPNYLEHYFAPSTDAGLAGEYFDLTDGDAGVPPPDSMDPHAIALHLGRRLYRTHARISELEKELQLDLQTGLLNHRTWHGLVDEFIDSGVEDIGVIFIDMSNLKVVNDRLGHKLGDQLIDETASILKHKLRTNESTGFADMVSYNPDEAEHAAGRLGGDEFGILCDLAPRFDTPEDEVLPVESRMQVLIDRLRSEFDIMLKSHEHSRDLRKYGFDVAIGGAIWRPDMPAGVLLKEADDAMYRDKQNHKRDLLSAEERTQLKVVRHLLERVGVRTEFLDE